MEWIDDELKRRMGKERLRMLNELKLCFNKQYPTKNRQEALNQLVFSCCVINEEFDKRRGR